MSFMIMDGKLCSQRMDQTTGAEHPSGINQHAKGNHPVKMFTIKM